MRAAAIGRLAFTCAAVVATAFAARTPLPAAERFLRLLGDTPDSRRFLAAFQEPLTLAGLGLGPFLTASVIVAFHAKSKGSPSRLRLQCLLGSLAITGFLLLARAAGVRQIGAGSPELMAVYARELLPAQIAGTALLGVLALAVSRFGLGEGVVILTTTTFIAWRVESSPIAAWAGALVVGALVGAVTRIRGTVTYADPYAEGAPARLRLPVIVAGIVAPQLASLNVRMFVASLSAANLSISAQGWGGLAARAVLTFFFTYFLAAFAVVPHSFAPVDARPPVKMPEALERAIVPLVFGNGIALAVWSALCDGAQILGWDPLPLWTAPWLGAAVLDAARDLRARMRFDGVVVAVPGDAILAGRCADALAEASIESHARAESASVLCGPVGAFVRVEVLVDARDAERARELLS